MQNQPEQKEILEPEHKLISYKDFFDEDLLSDVVEYANKVYRYPFNCMTSNAAWSPDVVHDSTPVLVHEVPHQTIANIRQRVSTTVEKKTGVTGLHAIRLYYWTRLSYIPWHHDGHVDTAITVYLNKDWKQDFGGLFLYDYERNGLIRGIVPSFNNALLQRNGLWHSTTPVTWSGGVRLSMQIFKGKAKS